jgi:preprotein translocase subunit SecD
MAFLLAVSTVSSHMMASYGPFHTMVEMVCLYFLLLILKVLNLLGHPLSLPLALVTMFALS